jgi:hypothetical protein
MEMITGEIKIISIISLCIISNPSINLKGLRIIEIKVNKAVLSKNDKIVFEYTAYFF